MKVEVKMILTSEYEPMVKNLNSTKSLRAYEYSNYTLYVSYETVVAFQYKGKKYCTDKKYSVTTSKHLGQIEGCNKVEATAFNQLVKNLDWGKYEAVETTLKVID